MGLVDMKERGAVQKKTGMQPVTRSVYCGGLGGNKGGLSRAFLLLMHG